MIGPEKLVYSFIRRTENKKASLVIERVCDLARQTDFNLLAMYLS